MLTNLPKFAGKGFPLLVFFLAMNVLQPAASQTRSASTLEDKWPRYTFEAGGYLTNMNSNFRLGLENLGLGLEINFEDALGLNTSALTFSGQFLYRFSKTRKSALRASYFQITRKAEKVLEADLEIRDTVFTKGTSLSTKFTMGIIKLDYCYSFLLDDRVNLSASFGFYVVPLNFSINRDEQKEEQSDFIAPLPTFGITTLFYLSPKFLLKQRLNFFYLKIPNFEGGMSDILVLLEYYPWRNIGFGAGYNAFSINVEATKEGGLLIGDLIGNIGYKHNGIVFYAVVSF